MKNLGDLNDLYNAQDVILLTEMIEHQRCKILMALIRENAIRLVL